jgi:hypothetical protein
MNPLDDSPSADLASVTAGWMLMMHQRLRLAVHAERTGAQAY